MLYRYFTKMPQIEESSLPCLMGDSSERLGIYGLQNSGVNAFDSQVGRFEASDIGCRISAQR